MARVVARWAAMTSRTFAWWSGVSSALRSMSGRSMPSPAGRRGMKCDSWARAGAAQGSRATSPTATMFLGMAYVFLPASAFDVGSSEQIEQPVHARVLVAPVGRGPFRPLAAGLARRRDVRDEHLRQRRGRLPADGEHRVRHVAQVGWRLVTL